ncbi:MAG: 16S rRNA (guanine(527)-N(7))-methyltransferase RsmG [Bacteroidia bacterium]|nr:16S rRNA (guanine(527)-N(7))-methyltransferase RsmG [Bacteroidia bacterium]
MNPVASHFQNLSPKQFAQFERLDGLYRSWNEKINVISRKDIDHLYLHHVLHSLSITLFVSLKPGTKVLDAGTGGGFPGIPLAIFFPEAEFTLVDSTAKKIKVVQAVSEEIGLTNVHMLWCRVEEINQKFDFVVSRAVTAFPEFVVWVRRLINPLGFNDIPNGIIYLKGGDMEDEIRQFTGKVKIQEISDYFEEEFFVSKKIIYLPIG